MKLLEVVEIGLPEKNFNEHFNRCISCRSTTFYWENLMMDPLLNLKSKGLLKNLGDVRRHEKLNVKCVLLLLALNLSTHFGNTAF